ncbi:MAG: DUF1566 domain-containing protein [Candidatus Electrothrix sp. AW5]|nr:DUF1566 domain-containing protein [Candidatus Electrothrix gigas]MCI5197431.1 DUF1566 domain-containing protein [Candidatus Electrothrix gigas]
MQEKIIPPFFSSRSQTMRTFFVIFFCVFAAATVHAACESNTPASTPNSQLIDNGDGTITDSKTGLMWKQCVEGLSGSDCTTGSADTFTWQEALQQPGVVNGTGFANYTDWRLPNIRELRSIVEEQCFNPAINATRFPSTPGSYVWSGSPAISYNSDCAWSVDFSDGRSFHNIVGSVRSKSISAVRLVRNAK